MQRERKKPAVNYPMSPCWSWGLNPGLQNSSQLLRAWGHLHLLTPCSRYSSSEAAKLLQSVRVAEFGLVSTAFLGDAIHASPWVTKGWQDHVPSCCWGPARNPSASWVLGQKYCAGFAWVGLTGVVCASRVVTEWLERMNRSKDKLSITKDLDLFLFSCCKSESILFIFILPCCDTFKIHGTFNFWFSFNTL